MCVYYNSILESLYFKTFSYIFTPVDDNIYFKVISGTQNMVWINSKLLFD